jgi:hypothetical protein
MRLITIALATAVVALSSLGSAAPVSDAGVAGAASRNKDDGQKIVCKSQRFVGSHLSERVCKTQSEWANGSTRDKGWLDKNNGTLLNDQLIKGEGGGMHISISTPASRPH